MSNRRRFGGWGSLLAGLCLAAFAWPGTALAQDGEEMSGSAEEELREEIRELRAEMDELQADREMDGEAAEGEAMAAPDETAGTASELWGWMERNIRFGAIVNTFFLHQTHTRASTGLPPNHGTFNVGEVEFDLYTAFEHGVNARFDLDFHADDGIGDSNVTGAVNAAYPNQLSVEQAYIEIDLAPRIAPDVPVRFQLGKWNSPLGLEHVDAPKLWQFSRANTSVLLRPDNQVGLRGGAYTDGFDAEGWITNGWEATQDGSVNTNGVVSGFAGGQDNEFVAGARVAAKLMPQEIGGKTIPLVTIAPALQTGHSETNALTPITGNINNDAGDLRTIFNLVSVLNMEDRFKLGAEFNLGHESDMDGLGQNADWFGVMFSGTAFLTDRVSATGRFEYIDDDLGTMTGDPIAAASGRASYLRSLTASVQYHLAGEEDTIGENFVFRLEYRYDRSNHDLFSQHGAGGFDRSWRSQIAAQVYFYF